MTGIFCRVRQVAAPDGRQTMIFVRVRQLEASTVAKSDVYECIVVNEVRSASPRVLAA